MGSGGSAGSGSGDAAAPGSAGESPRDDPALIAPNAVGPSTGGSRTIDAALSSALSALGLGGSSIPLQTRMLVQMVGTTGGVTLFMAFLVFGKRRRDGEPPAPDEVLQADAARMVAVPASSAVPHLPTPAPGQAGLSPEELAMPRWRRPSLLEARKADPLRSATAAHQSLTFDHGAVGPVEGHERRRLRYRLVRLLDQPDELRANEMGFLDEGDEVQLLERSGAYWLVLCPDGGRGWIHKMTLGDVVADADPPDDAGAEPASTADAEGVFRGYLAQRGA